MTAATTFDFSECRKQIDQVNGGINVRTLREMLDGAYMYQQDGVWLPNAEFLNSGWFVVVNHIDATTGTAYVATRFTQEGVDYFAEKLRELLQPAPAIDDGLSFAEWLRG